MGTTPTVTGQWADVPRGTSMGFGNLTLSVELDPLGNPVKLHRVSGAGGFSGDTLRFQTTDLRAGFPPIVGLLGRVVKNTWKDAGFDRETLADNLEVLKEPVVLFGELLFGEITPSQPFINNYPATLPRTRYAFLDLNDPFDTGLFNTDSSDADLTCHIVLDPNDLPPDLFSTMTPAQKVEVLKKIASVHPEIVMFAGTEDINSVPLLPGWGDVGGNSVLVNGVPLNGACDILGNGSVSSIGQSGTVPVVGQKVRVTGVLAFDIGHPDIRALEVHPVYAVDFLTATARDDWSGVWGDVNGLTYYVHHVLNTFWIFISSPFRDLTLLVAFQGQVQPDGKSVVGTASAMLRSQTGVGLGKTSFLLDPGKMSMTAQVPNSPLDGRKIRKLYDANGNPCPSIGTVTIGAVGSKVPHLAEIEGATVEYRVMNAAISKLPGVKYAWRATGGVPAGSQLQGTLKLNNLPPAGTSVTVQVQITTAFGCLFHGQRTFTTRSALQASRLKQWLEFRHQAVQTMNRHVAAGQEIETPSDATLEELRKSLDDLAKLLDEMGKAGS